MKTFSNHSLSLGVLGSIKALPASFVCIVVVAFSVAAFASVLPPGSGGGFGVVNQNTGSFHYTYPIKVPAGPRGVKPNIALRYSSQFGGSRWVGKGWRLPVPAVERMGDSGGVGAFNATDKFVLNGQTLVLVQDNTPGQTCPVSNLDEQCIYRTENDSNLRVTHSWVQEAKDGPRYWFVYDHKGNKTSYGGYSGSTLECGGFSDEYCIWLINKIEDTFGNTVTYDYGRFGWGLDLNPPLVIAWPGYEVVFTYATVPNRYYSRAGKMLRTNDELTTVTVNAVHPDGARTLIRSYHLAYTQLPDTAEKFLLSITEKGSDGMSTLPPVVFSSGFAPSDPASVTWTNSSGIPFPLGEGSARGGWAKTTTAYADMNGDGRPDAIMSCGSVSTCNRNLNGWWVYLNNGSGFDAGFEWPGTSNHIGWSWSWINESQVGANGGTTILSQLVDFDGDGTADHIRCNTTTGGWTVSRNTGSGFAPSVLWPGADCSLSTPGSGGDMIGLGYKNTVDQITHQMIDVNGDGWLDFIDCDHGTGCLARLNLGDVTPGFRNQSFYLPGSVISLSTVAANGAVFVTSILIDINGDGLPDHVSIGGGAGCSFTATCMFKVHLNVGGELESRAIDWPGINMLENVQINTSNTGTQDGFVEINGDGLVDFSYLASPAECGGAENTWAHRFNTGTGWGPVQCNGWGHIAYDYQLTQVHRFDIDGDGVPESVSRSPGVNWKVLSMGQVAHKHLIRKVTHPLGGETEIVYVSAASNTAAPRLPGPLPVVASITFGAKSVWEPTVTYSTSFSYSGSQVYRGLDRIRFLGFKDVTETNNTTGDTVQKYYTQNAPSNVGKEYRRTFRAGGTKMIREEWTDFVDDTAAPYFTPIRRFTQAIYDNRTPVHAEVIDTEYFYNSHGRVWKEEHHGVAGVLGDERTILRTFVENTSKGMVLLASEWLYAGRGNAQTLKKVDYYFYDGAWKHINRPTHGFLWRTRTGNTPYWAETYYNADTALVYQPDSLGRVTSISDLASFKHLPIGRRTINRRTLQYATDFPTFVLSETNQLGHVERSAYYGVNGEPVTLGFFGKVKTTLDPNGVGKPNEAEYQTLNYYDVFGRVTRVVRPYDDVVTVGRPGTVWYSYFDMVNPPYVQTFVRENDNIVREKGRGYVDGFDREVKTYVPPDGPTAAAIFTKTLYNSLGKVAAKSLPSFLADLGTRSTTYQYDVLGRVVQIQKPDVGVETIRYEGWDKIVTNGGGFTTTYTHDAYGNVVGVVDAEGNSTSYGYDTLGNLTETVDWYGNITKWVYDALSQKRTTDDPDMGLWIYSYDDVGNKTRVEHAEGAVNYTYDALQRLLTIDTNDDGIADVTRVYDDPVVNGIGRLVATENRNNPCGVAVDRVPCDQIVREKVSYDRRGRIEQEDRIIPNAPPRRSPFRTKWVYNSQDQVTDKVFPNGLTALSKYNGHGKVKSIKGYVDDAIYDAAGNLTDIFYASGVHTVISHRPSGAIATIQTTLGAAAPYQKLAYTWGPNGNLIEKHDAVTGVTKNYFYDRLERLTRVEEGVGNPVETYKYDAIGNLVLKNGVTQKYQTGVNALGQSLGGPHAISDAAGLGEFHYDRVGNMLDGAGRTYTYNGQNRPFTIQDANQGTLTFHFYNAEASRRYKRSDGGVTVDETWYGGKGFIRKNGTETAFLMLNGRRVAGIETRGATTMVRYFHFDHLGSTHVVTDKAGNLVEAIEYEAFGTATSDSAPALTDYKYTGQELDASTQIYNYNARLYDPVIGRFLSADSEIPDVYNSQALNRYSYVLNNPLRYTDPTGYFSEGFYYVGLRFIEGFAKGFITGGLLSLMTGPGSIPTAIVFGLVEGAIYAGLAVYEVKSDNPRAAEYARLGRNVVTYTNYGVLAGAGIYQVFAGATVPAATATVTAGGQVAAVEAEMAVGGAIIEGGLNTVVSTSAGILTSEAIDITAAAASDGLGFADEKDREKVRGTLRILNVLSKIGRKLEVECGENAPEVCTVQAATN